MNSTYGTLNPQPDTNARYGTGSQKPDMNCNLGYRVHNAGDCDGCGPSSEGVAQQAAGLRVLMAYNAGPYTLNPNHEGRKDLRRGSFGFPESCLRTV